MKTAMITGINGQDGYYLSRLLLQKGYRVVGLSRRVASIDSIVDGDTDFVIEHYSLHDPSTLYHLIRKYEPQEFYNLAGQSHVGASFKIPVETAETVALAAISILEAIRHTNREIRLYQASSSEIFGANLNLPFNEQTQMIPSSPYACSKALAHNLVRNYRESYDMHASAGILFNHESPKRSEMFVTRKITMAAAKIKLGLQEKLYLGNLDAKRDWGFAGDYVDAMWRMLQQEQPDDYVISTGEVHSVKDWLNSVFTAAGLSVKENVIIDENLFRPKDVHITWGDSTKARKKLGWEPKVGFNDLATIMFNHDLEEAKSLAL